MGGVCGHCGECVYACAYVHAYVQGHAHSMCKTNVYRCLRMGGVSGQYEQCACVYACAYVGLHAYEHVHIMFLNTT